MPDTEKPKYKHYNKITTYEDFVGYVLRALGAPVINIEVADEQIRDRITDALQLYIEEHYDSVQEFYWVYRCTENDVANGYVQMPPDVLDIIGIWTKTTTANYDIDGLDDPQYQFFQHYWTLGAANTGLVQYEMIMQQLSLIRQTLNAEVQYGWRPRERKCYLYKQLKVGNPLLFWGNRMLDPETDECIWDSMWLKKYATALVGIQWGTNLDKFSNVPTSGGATINADQILQRYTEQKQQLEEQFKAANTEPPRIMIA